VLVPPHDRDHPAATTPITTSAMGTITRHTRALTGGEWGGRSGLTGQVIHLAGVCLKTIKGEHNGIQLSVCAPAAR